MHNFKSSLAKGKAGEELLLKLMPELTPLNGRKADFVNLKTEELYELKSDQYDMNATKNFFIELWSDVDKAKPGGPVQALAHGSKYWLYMFPKNKTLFTFETEALVEWIQEQSSVYKLICIPNVAWVTAGIKVPRLVLQHLYTEKHF